MPLLKTRISLLAGCALLTLASLSAAAQKLTGAPGSPSATTTIDGKQLPPPPSRSAARSSATRRSRSRTGRRVVPPKGAPNVLLIMTDDVGFGVPSTFGGVIPTPTLDRIAHDGLRYTNFHSTALCSPTRAALITGRNHHSVGFGVISEQSTGYPGYNSIIAKDKATIGRILQGQRLLRRRGSARTTTRRPSQASQAGPFDQWPIGMGFEYFYGFVGGDTNQWQPNLFRNTTRDLSLSSASPDWNLITAMADDAIDYMNQHQRDRPGQAVLRLLRARRHACAAPPDAGVDREDQRHAPVRQGLERAARADLRQPEEARRHPAGRQADAVAERPAARSGITLTADEKKLFIRQVEVFAAYLGLHRPRDRPRDPGRRGHGQARQHADHLHQRRQRHERRGHARSARRTRSLRSMASTIPVEDQLKISTTSGARDQTYPTWRSAGRGRSTRRSRGPSRSPRTSAAPARAWRSRGRRTSRTRAASASSSIT